MKKIYLVSLLFISIFTLLACSNDKNKTIDSSKTVESTKKEKLKEYSIHDSSFKVPSSWEEKEGNTENLFYFYPSDGQMTVSFIETDDSIMNASSRSSFIDGFKNSDGLKNVSVVDGEETGEYSYGWNTSFDINDKTYDGEIVVVDVEGGLLQFLIATRNNTFEKYRNDFSEILQSLNFYPRESKKAQVSSNSEEETQTNTSNSSSEKSTTEAKSWLNSYREFVDRYSVFVDKYVKNPNDLTLLSELTEISAKESEFVSQSSQYRGDFSDSDLAEYTETTSKLLRAVEKLGTIN